MALDGRGDEPLARLGITDVDLLGARRTTGRADLRGGPLRQFDVEVADDDGGALGRQPDRRGAAEAGAGSGHHRDAADQQPCVQETMTFGSTPASAHFFAYHRLIDSVSYRTLNVWIEFAGSKR